MHDFAIPVCQIRTQIDHPDLRLRDPRVADGSGAGEEAAPVALLLARVERPVGVSGLSPPRVLPPLLLEPACGFSAAAAAASSSLRSRGDWRGEARGEAGCPDRAPAPMREKEKAEAGGGMGDAGGDACGLGER